MPNGSASCSTGKSSVRNQGYIPVKAHTGNRRCGGQHFLHPRATLWTFVSDYNDIFFVDPAAKYGFICLLFRLKNPCRALVHHHFRSNSGTFDHSAVRREIAPQNGNAPCLAVWVINRADDIMIKYLCLLSDIPY